LREDKALRRKAAQGSSNRHENVDTTTRAGGRPQLEVPNPKKRRRGHAWQIYWSVAKRAFALSAGRVPEEEAELRRLEVALALRTDDWPDWAVDAPAIRRYRELDAAPGSGEVLDQYEQHLRAEVTDNWASTSLATLRELEKFAGKPIVTVTASDAQRFLDHVRSTPGPSRKITEDADAEPAPVRSIATRNRARAACRRFFGWLLRSGRIGRNPFAGTKALAEPRSSEIVHLSKQERDAVLDAAAGDEGELAVWLALYGGLRRGELLRCRWKDVDLARRKLIISSQPGRTTKTRRPRVIDLAGPAVKRLSAMSANAQGRVLSMWPEGGERAFYQAECFLGRLRAKLATDEHRWPRIEEKLKWNVFRHTFGSLLAQAGVSIFKIASWMGNSVEVCTRHYAAMRPDHDEDIEKLG